MGGKLPNNYEVKIRGITYMDGAIELHRLAVEDPAQLERRKEEITVAIVNATCSMSSVDDGMFREVSQAPLPNSSPGHGLVARLLRRRLGLGAPAAEQGRRSKQGCKTFQWRFVHPPVLCRFLWLH